VRLVRDADGVRVTLAQRGKATVRLKFLVKLTGDVSKRTLAFANACGTLSCRAVGGVDGLPTRDEALALLGAS
jgi:hypothetical protein